MKQYKKFFTGPRKLLLALSVLLCVWFGTAYGASAAGGDYTENEISMDVVCGYDGHVKGGRYLPVQVILTNGQETDSAGQIQIKTLESNNDIYQHDYPVEVPAGEKVEKHLFLPEPHNDFIFSVICEELGLVGAVLVIGLFALLVWRGFVIGMRAKDKFGSMLAIGLTSQIGVQALLNMAVVTNTMPNTGISLPFFSYGGTSLVMLLFQMGVVLAVSRQSRDASGQS